MASISYAEAAHLLRRMGFGGPSDEINDLVSRGREGAVDYLINYDRVNNKALDELLAVSFDASTFFGPFDIQRWWFTRMVYTRRPFEEKMTLFWHNHFATSYTKVIYPFMYVQNKVLRSHALDRFDDLLLGVSQDVAMLYWLDGILNVLGRPNENFARELQELFTMGVNDVVTGEQNYTEKDVKEIARAFTGWRYKIKRQNIYKPKFVIAAGEHDNGAKEVYGRSANFTGEDIIAIICARRATPRFLVKKLFTFFVYPLGSSAEDMATIEKFASIYMSSDHSIEALVRAIFTSDEFFSERARFALIKSPIEYIVGAIRMLGARYNPGGPFTQQADFLAVILSARMGLELLNPPDVAGWEMGLGWLNTATMIERFNFADYLAINRPANNSLPGASLTSDRLKSFTAASAEQTVEKFLSALGPLNVAPETVQALADYLQTDDQGNRINFVVNDETVDKSVRGLVHLILCMQEFQLN
jgi:uncharacterized protein (DUF1800 family)